MKRVIHAVSIMNRAGQETFLMNLYRNINRSKVQFDFQCSEKGVGDFDQEIAELGGQILYLGENTWRIPVVKYLNNIIMQYRFFKAHPEYDVYHIHTYHAFNSWLSIVGAKLGGVKKVILHSHNTYGLHPRLHMIFRKLLTFMKIERLACSEAAAQWMYGEKAVALGQTEVIHNGIEPEQFRYDPELRDRKRKELEIADQFVVGHVGRFNQQKNHKFLIEIFAEIKKRQENAILLLMGTGELEEAVRRQVAEYGLTEAVKFMGVRSDVKELLQALDVFLFPSLHEGLSVVAIEAQAAGLPMVAADTLTPETKITECLEFMPLSESPAKWAEAVLAAGQRGHQDTTAAIAQAGYDMRVIAKTMEKRYL